jgi:MYXO-CTERM domain-containing protein
MTGKTQGRRVLRCRLAPVDIGRLGLPAAPGDPNVAAVLALAIVVALAMWRRR